MDTREVPARESPRIRPALVQKVTFESISENWALVNHPLAPRKKAIGDILHQSPQRKLAAGGVNVDLKG